MDETGRDDTPAMYAGASATLRTPQDELADAQAVNAMVYRVNALGRAVQALADPDRDNTPTGPEALDGRLRALDELGAALVEAAEGAMEPASELLLATRIRADAKAVRP